MTKISIRISFIILFIGCFTACDAPDINGCPRDYYFSGDNSLLFNILDESGQNLLTIGVNKYIKSEVKLLDENEEVYPYTFFSNSGYVTMDFIHWKEDKGAVNQMISKRFFLVLSKQDTDTIDIDFRMQIDRCDEQIMEYLKVAYNDSVYFDDFTERVIPLDFIKEGMDGDK